MTAPPDATDPTDATGPTSRGSGALWGGRFAGGPADALAALSKSTHFDWRLAPHDIAGSRAHARVLHGAGLLDDPTLAAMLDALERLRADVESGAFLPAPDDEDVHTALERGLIERAGADVGGRLRAGRSRNDQIATLFRMYLREHARVVAGLVLDVVAALVEQATRHLGVAMPGRTHLQHAQPVLLSHHLLAHAWALLRDVEPAARLGRPHRGLALRLGGSRRVLARARPRGGRRRPRLRRLRRELHRRHRLARLRRRVLVRRRDDRGRRLAPRRGGRALGDQGVLVRHARRRVLDGVEHHAAEEEPRRRRAGPRARPAGSSGTWPDCLTTLKALPLAYNRDLQEDKEPVFDAVDTLEVLLPAFSGMVATMVFDTARLESLAPQGFSLATDVAEWLVREGVPFRVAHEVAGACVRRCEERGVELWDLTDADLAELSAHLTPGVRDVLSVEGSMASRSAKGAPPRSASPSSSSASSPRPPTTAPGPPSSPRCADGIRHPASGDGGRGRSRDAAARRRSPHPGRPPRPSTGAR